MRFNLKQIMMGLAVQENGLPLLGHVLSGNTSDKTWNTRVVGELADLIAGEQGREAICVADFTMVTEENIHALKAINEEKCLKRGRPGPNNLKVSITSYALGLVWKKRKRRSWNGCAKRRLPSS